MITVEKVKKSIGNEIRESGNIEQYKGCVVAEYENRGMRLLYVADVLLKSGIDDFYLFDYKGSIATNKYEVINFLTRCGENQEIEVNGDSLYIMDEPYSIIDC